MRASATPGTVFGALMTLSFFEELDFDDTAETQPQEPAPRRRPGRRLLGSRVGGGGGGRGRGGGGDDLGGDGPSPGRGRPRPQLQRLAILVVIVLVLLVASILWIRSCQEAAQKRAYRNYVADVNSIVVQSNRLGKQLDDALSSNTNSSSLLARVRTIEKAQGAVQTQAESLGATGSMRPLHPWFVAAMQYRTIGLQQLERTMGKAFAQKTITTEAAAPVSRAYEDLLASDVVYSDSFRTPGQQALTAAGVRDAPIDESAFALTPGYVKPEDMKQALAVIASGRGTGGTKTTSCPKNARVGTQLDGVSVETAAGTKALSPAGVNVVTASSSGVRYLVTLSNHGDIRVNQIRVRFRELGHTPRVFPQTKRLKFLNPGQSATVTFSGAEPSFGPPETVRVEIIPDPCETNPGNNVGSYRVQYQLG